METIADAYESNARIHEELKAAVSSLTAEQLTARPAGEKWSVQEIVEHIAMVYGGTGRICAKLVAGAKEAGRAGDGRVNLSSGFGEKSKAMGGMKVEAPERVHPTGTVGIEESFAKIDETERAFASAADSIRAHAIAAPRSKRTTTVTDSPARSC